MEHHHSPSNYIIAVVALNVLIPNVVLSLTLGACVRVTVVVFVCGCGWMCVTALAATYLVYESQVRYYTIFYGVANVCTVWISLKLSFSSWASFAFSSCKFLVDRMNKNSDGFVSRGLVSRCSDNFYNSTGSCRRETCSTCASDYSVNTLHDHCILVKQTSACLN